MNADVRSGLVADIGGTNARFAIVDHGRVGKVRAYPVADFNGPAAAVRKFLGELEHRPRIRSAVLAVAGPVEGGRARLTNGAWKFGTGEVAAELGIEAIRLVNDFAALARGLPLFQEKDLLSTGGGEADLQAPRAVLGPGTGLGVALYVPADGGVVVPTEAGHVTLPAEDEYEWGILEFFRERFGHVSAERVLSGSGLEALYEALRLHQDGTAEAGLAADRISAAAISGDCDLCRATLETFCGILGSFAGNLALTAGARGGIYVAGGIVPRFPEFLAASPFRERFESKGRFRDWLSRIPTFVVTHPDPAFPGLVALLDD